MKKLISTIGLCFAISMAITIEGFAQNINNPLQNTSNYKTQSTGKLAIVKSEGNSVLTETEEATNYKRPQQKIKIKRTSLETSSSPKRNYKMKNTTV